MPGYSYDRRGNRVSVEIPPAAIGISHSDGRYSRGCITSRRTRDMPQFEMTGQEIVRYGENLTIWQKLMLIQAWAPLLAFGQRFVMSADPYAKSLIVAEACEWLAAKTDSNTDDELVKHLAAMVKTPEGEAFVKWIVSKIEGMKA